MLQFFSDLVSIPDATIITKMQCQPSVLLFLQFHEMYREWECALHMTVWLLFCSTVSADRHIIHYFL